MRHVGFGAPQAGFARSGPRIIRDVHRAEPVEHAVDGDRPDRQAGRIGDHRSSLADQLGDHRRRAADRHLEFRPLGSPASSPAR